MVGWISTKNGGVRETNATVSYFVDVVQVKRLRGFNVSNFCYLEDFKISVFVAFLTLLILLSEYREVDIALRVLLKVYEKRISRARSV